MLELVDPMEAIQVDLFPVDWCQELFQVMLGNSRLTKILVRRGIRSIKNHNKVYILDKCQISDNNSEPSVEVAEEEIHLEPGQQV